MSRHRTPAVLPTLFPIADEPKDWTEAASLILVAIGAAYFIAHFVVAFFRGALS